MKKLSFKDYLDSKQKLKEAIETTSKCKSIYTVTKYCRLPLGEKSNKANVSFKPNQKIIIEWFYPSPTSIPEPIAIILENDENVDIETFSTYWNSSKLLNWLNKNTKI